MPACLREISIHPTSQCSSQQTIFPPLDGENRYRKMCYGDQRYREAKRAVAVMMVGLAGSFEDLAPVSEIDTMITISVFVNLLSILLTESKLQCIIDDRSSRC